ncbi:xanthine dehydrogenase family protein molybdopterin-binding subunit [Phaeovulum vinaykumarii]|uniref:Isoquinoline 1-oxidoreductase, beta subunit n=1 Tax=Phaeovulum vinaykumarii TaxID=407234 RepID=A0A1N7MGJ5_9RHOB|nr:molybdopterin cofactor-binding domain-containing protein [Phaeovulum vinaykumarii]SIS85069.1 isoquinoline 1-oxidoreductase, beta subunit [Phaeovulum vinaykumarii]SOC12070.1 isoquinoline 1-oxidoreductase beta subunit [Phaeovulum vinaykumarii]
MNGRKIWRRARRMGRRAFLVGSVLTGAGVAFGVHTAARRLPNPLRGDGVMNPWLVIGPDGPVVVVPRAEMGQGVTTTLAALVAEELDADWDAIRVIHGPPAAAYFNRVILRPALPFAEYRTSALVEALGTATEVLPKAMGMQITGGSTSTVDGFTPMRAAGATAREALKAAAAERLSLPVADLKTVSGHVVAPDGRRLAYADLAPDAAGRDMGRIALRPAADWRLLGRALPRKDMAAKVTGAAVYGLDIRLEGMRFATLARPPVCGGTLARHDAKAAQAVPGVERVLPLGGGIAVVARNSWAALKGLEAAAPEWETPADAPDTDAIHEGLARAISGGLANSRLVSRGGEPPADTPVLEYRLPPLAHATMEPMNATALFQGGRLHLWAGCQTPEIARHAAARVLGIAPDLVALEVPFLGGGFGRRLETDFVTLAAELAGQMPGVPVQLFFSREEDMTHDFYRPPLLARARIWTDAQGGPGLHLDLATQSVTRSAGRRMTGLPSTGPDKIGVEGAFDQPYALPNLRVRGHLADLPLPVGFWRSVGHSANSFVLESALDELAHLSGRDPFEMRHALIAPEDPSAARVLARAAQNAGWGQDGRALGIAFCHSYGTTVAEVIEVTQTEHGIRIPRAWVVCDPGQALDPGIIAAQMEGGLIFGLSAAIRGQITLTAGAVDQLNFPDFDGLRINECPQIFVDIQPSGRDPGGVGEPAVPPAAPALANALFALTGRRARSLPLQDMFDFA